MAKNKLSGHLTQLDQFCDAQPLNKLFHVFLTKGHTVHIIITLWLYTIKCCFLFLLLKTQPLYHHTAIHLPAPLELVTAQYTFNNQSLTAADCTLYVPDRHESGISLLTQVLSTKNRIAITFACAAITDKSLQECKFDFVSVILLPLQVTVLYAGATTCKELHTASGVAFQNFEKAVE